MIRFLLFLSSLIIGQSLLAQACCSGGTPLSANLGVQGMSAERAQIVLAYDYNTQNTLVGGTRKFSESFRSRNTHALLLRAKYAITNRIGIIGLFSWLKQEEENRTINNRTRQTSAEGIGDIIGVLQYQLLSKNKTTIVVAGGVKFPVGKTDVEDPATGLLLNADMQPGSGSVDWLGVVNWTQTNILRESMVFNSSLTYRLTSDFKRFEGLQTYRFGDEWQILFGLNDQIFLSEKANPMILYPQLMFRYRRTDIDQTDGNETPNTGGQWLFLVPGLQLQFSPSFSWSINGEIPLYRKLTGIQLTTSYRLNTGIVFHIF